MKLEYGLLIALIASVSVIAFTHISASLENGFTFLAEETAPEGMQTVSAEENAS